MNLRCKHKKGQQTVSNITGDSTLTELLRQLSQISGVDISKMIIRKGYPPTILDYDDEMLSKSIKDLNLKSGDTLTIDELSSTAVQTQITPEVDISSLLAQQSDSSILVRHSVPADNSCLFYSINFALNKGKVDVDCSQEMRGLVAALVMSEPDEYTEAVLGLPNAEYCSWIMNKENWGGGIEISLMSRIYEVEICVVDTQTLRVDRFGEDKGYSTRILVIYDGIHYDPLALESLSDGSIKTIFDVKDEQIFPKALELAGEAKRSRQFTDLQKFSLTCLDCKIMLRGQREAQDHAQSTGHVNFGET